MPSPTQKKIGRPPLKAPTEKRAQIGFFVRADIKRQLMKAAKASGRTLSAEVEHLIEGGLMAAEIAKLTGASSEDMRERLLLAVMNSNGFAPTYGPDANGKKIIVRWERRKLGGFIDTIKEDQS
jgi:hypothetical protein